MLVSIFEYSLKETKTFLVEKTKHKEVPGFRETHILVFPMSILLKMNLPVRGQYFKSHTGEIGKQETADFRQPQSLSVTQYLNQQGIRE